MSIHSAPSERNPGARANLRTTSSIAIPSAAEATSAQEKKSAYTGNAAKE